MDKPTYHKTILCLIGVHKASKYVFNRIDGKDYCICKICGKRLNRQRNKPNTPSKEVNHGKRYVDIRHMDRYCNQSIILID